MQRPGNLAGRPMVVLRPAREQEALHQRRRAALVGAAALCGLFAFAREGVFGASGSGEEAGLGFVAPPAPPQGALRGAGVAAPSAATTASAGAGAGAAHAAGAGVAVFAFAVAASSLLGGRRRGQQQRSAVALRAKKKLEELNVGDEFEGTVSRVANIGIWLDIGAEKEALWPRMQLPKGKEFKPGDKVTGLKILEVTTGDKPADRKIRVTTRSPVSDVTVGATVEGTVARSSSFGVFFDIGASTDVLAPNGMLVKAGSEYKTGDKVTLKIVKIDGERVTVTTNLEGGAAAGAKPAASGKTFKVGDKVTGTVTNVNGDFGLFVDIGAARDALCRSSQLEKPLSEYKKGDTIDNLRVSSVDAERERVEVSPRRLPSEVKIGERLEGTVLKVSSFGIFFDAGLATDVLAPLRFLSKDIGEYSKGEVADLIVQKVEVDRDRITVSTKSEGEMADEMGIPLAKLVRGATVPGTVKRITDVGLFLDIGAAKDALLRTKSLPKPASEYQVGDELDELIIIKVDAEAELLEVGLPETMAAAAEAAGQPGSSLGDFTPGMEVTGTVTRAMEFGVFLDVGASRDALWPANQLPKPVSEYKVGDKIEGLKITEADPVKSRLAVSQRPGPADFKVGDPIANGRVTKIMTFGLFVDIGASTEALLPLSLLAKPVGEYSQGDVLDDLTVSSVDPEKNKIAVGQVEGGAEEEGKISIEDLKVGEKIKGIVRMTKDYGIFMDIGLSRRDALLPASLMVGDKTPESFSVNTELEVYVAAVDKQANRITLSQKEPPAGGFSAERKISVDWVPPGDMVPDPKYWAAKTGDKEAVEEDPVDWKAWSEKYPGLITWAEQETEIYISPTAYGFHGISETIHASINYVPVPLHLRKPDAGLPKIPEFNFDDFKMGYQHHGIKPEIHTKYRQPPMNNPNWTWRSGNDTKIQPGSGSSAEKAPAEKTPQE